MHAHLMSTLDLQVQLWNLPEDQSRLAAMRGTQPSPWTFSMQPLLLPTMVPWYACVAAMTEFVHAAMSCWQCCVGVLATATSTCRPSGMPLLMCITATQMVAASAAKYTW